MLLEIHPQNPDERKIKQAVRILQAGGVIIYPTDTVYGIGCDISNAKAVERVCQIRRLDPSKAMLAFICKDIAQAASYATQIDNTIFKIMRKNLPGPFTFILNASKDVPKLFKNKKHTIGVRIPDNKIILRLVEELGNPILTTSLKSDDEILEYFTDPTEIYEDFEHLVDLVIDGGIGGNVPSTLVDCSKGEIEILREGTGVLEY
jgi:tRNA threonylcarbamoyl adenosine modification protein (Sua5/YciO/YrdC/YwlC family)